MNKDNSLGILDVEVKVPLFLGRAIEAAINGDSIAVDCVRQMTYMFYKLEVDYDSETVSAFLDQFRKVDQDCTSRLLGDDPSGGSDQRFITALPGRSLIISEMRREINVILCNEDPHEITPSHGTGATACHTVNYEKYHKLRYYPQLDDFFSYSEYFFFSPTHLVDRLDKLEQAEESIPQARVCLVPKDSRGPRVISCEPAELMFIQQGLMRKLYACLETNKRTAGLLNFTDQTINRNLARAASIDGYCATLDLKDASDRVSLLLIELVFPDKWVEALKACRSESTRLPDGSIVKLNKFAPMGSSCCFPVEALVFWACARAAIRLSKGIMHPSVYVYGDDIIVPTEFMEVTIHALESIGLLVNRDKSYGRGPFRESCGGDFHIGYEVTPVRVKRFLEPSCTSRLAWADFCNTLVAKFGWDDPAVARCVTHIETTLDYPFPRTNLEIPLTIRVNPSSSNDVFFQRRWSKDLHRWEYRVLSLATKELKRQLPDWEELLRKELVRRRESHAVPDQYSRWVEFPERDMDPGVYADLHSVRTKWSWVWLGEPDPTKLN